MHRPAHRRGRLRLLAATTTSGLAATALVLIPSGAAHAADQITNGTFDNGTVPWSAYGVSDGPNLVDGALCATAPATDPTAEGPGNVWDAAINQSGLKATKGSNYQLTFRAKASKPATITAAFIHGADPYESVAGGPTAVTTEWAEYTATGTSPLDMDNGQVVFQIGGAGEYTLCIDDVKLDGDVVLPPYVPQTGPRVRVNQVGYLPRGPKLATLVTKKTGAVGWQLRTAAGTLVARGTTTPKGVDPTSGQNVHLIDFSAVTRVGTNYVLIADGEESWHFDISPVQYQGLRKDALTLFYTQRSGVAIDDDIVPGYGRAAGHVGVAPNKGDKAVSCQAPATYYDGWTCSAKTTFDVTGGWYDAGDHGKYVVNGGIAVAQLMSTYERNQLAFSGDRTALGDGTLKLPETANGIPDILDEAKWELDWMLKMQVPANVKDPALKPYKGMAFHKVQDSKWTGLPLDPAADSETRELHRPSTAATLNLAAATAQGARLFKKFDAAYAAKLLKVSKSAYKAAKANPAVYAVAADGNSGGGAYEDDNVTDEFYWAAAELYLSTGSKEFLTDVNASPLSGLTAKPDMVFDVNGFGWQNVAPLARIDLATVPSKLPNRSGVAASVVAGADALLALQAPQAYSLTYAPADAAWAWGSNSNLLNNLVVLGSAYDLTGDVKYLNGVLRGSDYVFGRNALNMSYVTGYGTQYSQNQHSRLYAHQLNSALPRPPVGTIAGGPNTGIQDPLAASKLNGCKPQFCYIDDIQSYSTNELAINWNSALTWVASFIADQRDGIVPVS